MHLIFERILARFPQHFSFVFAYGSGVFRQTETNQDNMIDLVFTVDDPLLWHKENLKLNYNHYSIMKFVGAEIIQKLQEDYGAKMYFNTLVFLENKLIKYGVINTHHLIEDLLDWQTLYPSGRLQKPVKILKEPNNIAMKKALYTNLQSVMHAALLCLPESFSEEELYMKIASLSYNGDFRMYIGEDKKKISNIVKNQMTDFRNLYSDHLKTMPLLHWKPNQGIIEQDLSYTTILHHLNLLPKTVQHNLLVKWNKDGKYRDMEDVMQALAYDTECSDMLSKAIKNIVFWSSITQSAKGILTAGILKSIKYSSRKLKKMLRSISLKKSN